VNATYRILLNGAMRDRNPQEVATRLAELFKVPVEKAWPLLAKQGTVVKGGLDLQTAAKYQAALEQAGCNTLVVPEEHPTEPRAQSAVAAAPTVPQQDAKLIQAPKADPQPTNGPSPGSDQWTLAGAWRGAARWQKGFVVGVLLIAGGSLLLKVGATSAYGRPGDEALAVFEREAQIMQAVRGWCAGGVRGLKIKQAMTGTMPESSQGNRRNLPAIIAQMEFECVDKRGAYSKTFTHWWVTLAVDEEFKVARCIRVGDEQDAKASARKCGFEAATSSPRSASPQKAQAATAAPRIAPPASAQTTTKGPSFDCSKASTAIEHLICGNALLSELDVEMADAYEHAIKAAPNKDAFRKDHATWLTKTRDACLNQECLMNAYNRRIYELTE
jgi:uncharacterized protein YecT (DUF1311 family)